MNGIFCKRLTGFFFIAGLVCLSTLAFGQSVPNPSGDVDTVPIQGILYLIGAGLALGIKKVIGKRKGNI